MGLKYFIKLFFQTLYYNALRTMKESTEQVGAGRIRVCGKCGIFALCFLHFAFTKDGKFFKKALTKVKEIRTMNIVQIEVVR